MGRKRCRARYRMGHEDGCRVGNNWNWYKPQETCKWNTKFRSKASNRENGPTFLDFPLFQGIFQWDEPTKRFPFTAQLRLNGKRPKREPDTNLLRNVCRPRFWLIDFCRISQPKLLPLIVGSFSNYDGDGNENAEKAIGLISKTTTLHVQTLFVHFFAVTARLRRENP